MDMIETLKSAGIIPVIVIENEEQAVPLAQALVDGGIPAIEVTCRNAHALDAIRAIRAAFPQMVIAAGTILREEQVVAAQAAGVDFIVTPGLDADIVRAAQAAGLPIVPGVCNPTEITAAVKLGLETLKFFPAEISGGVAALTLYHGPFPNVRFVPTGGMNMENIGRYLAKPFIAACGGSYMAKGDDIQAGRFEQIAANCRRCREIVRESRT